MPPEPLAVMKSDRRRIARVRTLADALNGGRALHLREAASLLGVSEMTVRRDIAVAPDRFGYLGGYIVPRVRDAPYVMAREQGSHEAAKAAVCAEAASLVGEGDTIFIDCGTTMPHLVDRLPPGIAITVVCYALNIATALAARPNVRLILLGGLYHAASASFSVEEGLATLDRVGINTAFISAGGVHAEKGVSCSNFHEVAVKQAVLRKAVHRCLVADGSKLGKVRPAPFADLDDFDTLITTDGDQRDAIEARFAGRLIMAA